MEILRRRGVFVDCSFQRIEKSGFYTGFDPTAESLHVGHLVSLVSSFRLLLDGWNFFALVGGATASIGDPTGKTCSRTPLHASQIQKNTLKITMQIQTLFKNASFLHQKYNSGLLSARGSFEIVNNKNWLDKISMFEFLNVCGATRISSMLAKDSVKSRLSSESCTIPAPGLSFTEFTYQLFQAYDFLHLHKTCNVNLQVGGSDQWGNITSGIDLVSSVAGASVHGLTVPLLVDRYGVKIGKSLGNGVHLNSSAFEIYQFFLGTSDQDVERYLRFFTFIPCAEIENIMRAHLALRRAQRLLAYEVTFLICGEGLADSAALKSQVVFSKSLLAPDAYRSAFPDAPALEISEVLGKKTIEEVAVLVGVVASVSAARKVIAKGGMKLNGKVVQEGNCVLGMDHVVKNASSVAPGDVLFFSVGKSKFNVLFLQ